MVVYIIVLSFKKMFYRKTIGWATNNAHSIDHNLVPCNYLLGTLKELIK